MRTVGNLFASIARTPPGSEFRRHDAPEGLGLGAVVPVGPPRSDRPTRRGVGVLADERGRSHGHESPRRHEIGQLARGMFVGAIAVEHDHHGRRTVAPHGIQPPQGERSRMPAVDGYGEDRRVPALRRNGDRIVRRVANDRLRASSNPLPTASATRREVPVGEK